jgi:hypothetical protein
MTSDIDGGDGRPTAASPAGVPPAPSVTPGSAPPPPVDVERPQWSRRGCLLVGLIAGGLLMLGVVVLVLVLAVAKGWIGDKVDDLAKERQEIVEETGIETGSSDVVHPPQRDIRLGACDSDSEDGVRASGTLTNWTGTASDYRISLSFRAGGGGDDGAEFASTVVTVEGIGPDVTTSWSASVPSRPDGAFTCRVVRIDRWRSGDDPPGGS